MKTRILEIPRLQPLIVGVAAYLLANLGIAAMAPQAPEAGVSPTTTAGAAEHDLAAVPPKCPECGVVASTQSIGARGKPGAGYTVTVRMRDGSRHEFTATGARWQAGDRVILIAGADRSGD